QTALAALPVAVQQIASRWIDVYRPFIAPPRAALVWSGANTLALAPYAKHPASERSVFPLSWGLDNEVLESTVFHSLWPPDEQISAPASRRLHPSGIDVASVYGNRFARSLLSADLASYPRLGPVLDAIIARRPRISAASSVYE